MASCGSSAVHCKHLSVTWPEFFIYCVTASSPDRVHCRRCPHPPAAHGKLIVHCAPRQHFVCNFHVGRGRHESPKPISVVKRAAAAQWLHRNSTHNFVLHATFCVALPHLLVFIFMHGATCVCVCVCVCALSLFTDGRFMNSGPLPVDLSIGNIRFDGKLRPNG